MKPIAITIQDSIGEQTIQLRIADLVKVDKDDLVRLDMALHSILYPAVKVPDELAGMPIKDLPLRPAVQHTLAAGAIETVGELAQLKKTDLPRMRRMGPQACKEVVEALAQLGITMR